MEKKPNFNQFSSMEGKTLMPVPSLSPYDFTDPVDYLSARYFEARSTNANLALSRWLKDLGFSSATALVEVFQKKRALRARHVDAFAKALGLSQEESDYLLLLALHKNSETESEKRVLSDLIEQKRKSHPQPMEWHWLRMALAALSQIKETQLTLDAATRILSTYAHREEIEFHWNALIQDGFLSLDQNGVARRESQTFATPNDVSIESVHGYYRQVSDLAQKAVSVDVHRREYQCFAVPLDTRRLRELKQLIREFREKISETAVPGGNEVYQVNLQMFPLTSESIC